MGATPWESAILCLSPEDQCFRRRDEIKRRPANGRRIARAGQWRD
jgi:hypothetical protein